MNKKQKMLSIYTERENCQEMEDKRITKTKKCLKNTLIRMLDKEDFEHISITDLCREIDLNIDMDFISVSSYGLSSKSSGVVKLNKDVDIDITGRDVILVDDIIDSGLTLQHLKKLFSTRGPSSVKTIALLDKKVRHDPALTPDYVGFQCPDHFVVGYGLDYANNYRNLPYIGILKREVYQ